LLAVLARNLTDYLIAVSKYGERFYLLKNKVPKKQYGKYETQQILRYHCLINGRTARSWILEKRTDMWFNFVQICELFHFDSDFLRRRLFSFNQEEAVKIIRTRRGRSSGGL